MNRFERDGIGCPNLQIAECHGNIFRVNLRMNQSFQKGRGRILRAIDNGLAARMPPAWRAQSAVAIEHGVVTHSPQDHASMP